MCCIINESIACRWVRYFIQKNTHDEMKSNRPPRVGDEKISSRKPLPPKLGLTERVRQISRAVLYDVVIEKLDYQTDVYKCLNSW